MKGFLLLICFLSGAMLGRYIFPLPPPAETPATEKSGATLQKKQPAENKKVAVKVSEPATKAAAAQVLVAQPPALQEVGPARSFVSRESMLARLNRDETNALVVAEKVFDGLWRFQSDAEYQRLLNEGVPSIEELAWAAKQSPQNLATLMNTAHRERRFARAAKLGMLTLIQALQESYQAHGWAPDTKRFLQAMRNADLAASMAKDSGLRITGYLKMAFPRLKDKNDSDNLDSLIGAALASAAGDPHFGTVENWPVCEKCNMHEALYVMAADIRRANEARLYNR